MVVVLVWLSSCAGKHPATDEPITSGREAKSKIEAEARPLYAQAEKAFAAKNYDEAARLFQLLKTKYPRGRAQIYASYRLGILHYYKEEYAPAAKEFEYYLSRLPQSDLAFDAIYNLAASEFQLGQYDIKKI